MTTRRCSTRVLPAIGTPCTRHPRAPRALLGRRGALLASRLGWAGWAEDGATAGCDADVAAVGGTTLPTSPLRPAGLSGNRTKKAIQAARPARSYANPLGVRPTVCADAALPV